LVHVKVLSFEAAHLRRVDTKETHPSDLVTSIGSEKDRVPVGNLNNRACFSNWNRSVVLDRKLLGYSRRCGSEDGECDRDEEEASHNFVR
jgi:hypothetical protein